MPTCLCPCQFQRVVGQFFTDFGRLIAKWPLPFLVIPLMIAGGLSSGIFVHFHLIKGRPEDRLSLFLPDNLKSLNNLKRLQSLFPSHDLSRDRYEVLRTSSAQIIIVDPSPTEKNILRSELLPILKEILAVVKNVTVKTDFIEANWETLCVREKNSCVQHPIFLFLQQSDLAQQLRPYLTYPTMVISGHKIDNVGLFGGVRRFDNGTVEIAAALRVPFLLANDSPIQQHLAYLWQLEFLKVVGGMAKAYEHQVNLYYSTPISWATEIDRNGRLITPYLPLLLSALILFAVGNCLSSDWVLSKPWLGLMGTISAVLAVTSAVGLLFFCKFQFLQMIFIMPFLVLSISIDGMFLILSSWRNTHPLLPVEDRMAQTVGRSAVSIMITSLTDGLSFSVGSISQFAAIRIFCTYCALALLFSFLFQMSFFLACLALSGRREAANRHCITLRKIIPKSEAVALEEGHNCYIFCCTGGYVGQQSRNIPSKVNVQWMTEFLSTKYSDVISHGVVKALVIIVYLGYLAAAIWGILNIRVGIDIKDLVPFDSHLSREIEVTDRYFSDFGSYLFTVLDSPMDYHNWDVQNRLLQLYQNLSNTQYSAAGEFWLSDFRRATNNSRFDNEFAFLAKVRLFLERNRYKRYLADISFSKDGSGQIVAVKMLNRLRHVGFTNYSRIVTTVTEQFGQSGLSGFVYEPMMILVEQQKENLSDLIQNASVDVAVMIAVSILFMPMFFCNVFIGLAIVSINLGVAGFLSYWGVRLDLVCTICTMMAVGFSVDFVAHMVFHYMSTGTSCEPNRRIHRAMEEVGLPILQGALSTVIGVSTLSFVEAYMVRTFVKTVVLVIGLGVLHGLLFMPVILSICIPDGDVLDSFGHYQKVRAYLTTNLPKYLSFGEVKNLRMASYFAKNPSAPVVSEGQSHHPNVNNGSSIQTETTRLSHGTGGGVQLAVHSSHLQAAREGQSGPAGFTTAMSTHHRHSSREPQPNFKPHRTAVIPEESEASVAETSSSELNFQPVATTSDSSVSSFSSSSPTAFIIQPRRSSRSGNETTSSQSPTAVGPKSKLIAAQNSLVLQRISNSRRQQHNSRQSDELCTCIKGGRVGPKVSHRKTSRCASLARRRRDKLPPPPPRRNSVASQRQRANLISGQGEIVQIVLNEMLKNLNGPESKSSDSANQSSTPPTEQSTSEALRRFSTFRGEER